MMVGANLAPVQSSAASVERGKFTLPHLPTKGTPIDPNHVNHVGGGGLKGPGASESEGVIRVGAEYQAEIPPCCSNEVDRTTEHRAMVMWSPHPLLSEKKLEEYVLISKERFGYSAEQALGMLLWHGYNFDKSLADLSNFEPLQDEWTCEEKVLFEQAFNLYGKTFQKIRQMLPDKPISALVKYYYCWKKLRFKSSQLDKQAKKTFEEGKKNNGGHDAEMDEIPDEVQSEGGTNGVKTESGRDPATTSNGDVCMEEEENERTCANCHVRCDLSSSSSSSSTTDDGDLAAAASISSSSSSSDLCYACLQYLRRTGVKRVVTESEFRKNPYSHQRPHHHLHGQTEPPRGMRVTEEDLRLLTTESPARVEAVFTQLNSDVEALQRQIQKNKQLTTEDKMEIEGRPEIDNEDLVVNSRSNTVKSNRWTNEELLLAVQGVRQYGLDFKAIAEVIGNKSDAHIRSFYNNYKRRYNLESVLEEFKQAKAEQAVAGHEVEVPLFASTSSPLRRGVKKTEIVDNQECAVGGGIAVKPAISTAAFPNQTFSASNIKPSVIKVEVSNPNSLSQPVICGNASAVSVVIPYVSTLPSHHSSLSPAILQPSVNPPTSLSTTAPPRAQSLHIPAAHLPPAGVPINPPTPLTNSMAHSAPNLALNKVPSSSASSSSISSSSSSSFSTPSLPSHATVPHLPVVRPPLPPPKAHLPTTLHSPSLFSNAQQPTPVAAAPPNAHHSSVVSHPPPPPPAHANPTRPQPSSSSSRSLLPPPLPSSFPHDHNLKKTEREPRGSQVGSPALQFAPPSASGGPGHHPMGSLLRTSVASSSSSSSSTSSSRSLANSVAPNHSPLLPSACHPGISGHAQPTSIHFGHVAAAPSLNPQPPLPSHNPAYLPSHHAMAAASLHSSSVAASVAAAVAVASSSSSSGSLIRPHLPAVAQTHPFPPAAVVPLGAAPYLNRPIPSPQNNLVRPGAPIMFNTHSPVPGHTRSSGME